MRVFIILAIILNSAIALGQSAEFSFSGKPVAKFGKVVEGEIVRHTFNFTNKGDVPLIISDYKVGCSCTKVVFPQTPVMPGETGSITVTFDTKDKVGWQYRSIQLMDNTSSGITELELRLKVI